MHIDLYLTKFLNSLAKPFIPRKYIYADLISKRDHLRNFIGYYIATINQMIVFS